MISFPIPAAELTGYYGKTSAEKADHHFEKFYHYANPPPQQSCEVLFE